MENQANAFIEASSIAVLDSTLQSAVDRATSRWVSGRIATMAAYRHLGLSPRSAQGGLLEE